MPPYASRIDATTKQTCVWCYTSSNNVDNIKNCMQRLRSPPHSRSSVLLHCTALHCTVLLLFSVRKFVTFSRMRQFPLFSFPFKSPSPTAPANSVLCYCNRVWYLLGLLVLAARASSMACVSLSLRVHCLQSVTLYLGPPCPASYLRPTAGGKTCLLPRPGGRAGRYQSCLF